jgi:hypothetical protein
MLPADFRAAKQAMIASSASQPKATAIEWSIGDPVAQRLVDAPAARG